MRTYSCIIVATAVTVHVGTVSTAADKSPGHALLLNNHAVVLKGFEGFASDAVTFEAWLSSSDVCNAGTILSYALDSNSTNAQQRTADFNHFAIFDAHRMIACHAFTYFTLWPDPNKISCYSKYGNHPVTSILERDGSWHHIAVTWTAANHGTTKIYQDGLLMAQVETGATEPLQPGGALMLGADQDCYAGCTDSTQAYHGLMDEVRIWSVERTQEQILDNMRMRDGVADQSGLVAYWTFDDPNMLEGTSGVWQARDSSKNGHHLPLVTPPQQDMVTIHQGRQTYDTGMLSFSNNYALNEAVGGMPEKDLTVEMWARTPAYKRTAAGLQPSELLSYATHTTGAVPFSRGITDHVFVDDAILIEKYYVTDAKVGDGNTPLSTIGVSINANPRSNKGKLHHWINFDVDWKDNEWHHLAVTWRFETGKTELLFDGVANVPTWRGSAGRWQSKPATEGGVDPNMAAGTLRLPNGSLVLGQNQECYGGCFNPQSSLRGDLADVRIWSKALTQDAIRANRFKASLEDTDGLVARYVFTADNIQEGSTDANGLRKKVVLDSSPSTMKKPLYLWSDMPRFEVSTAPLADKQGQPLQLPDSPWLDHALFLSDQQVLLATNFQNFPSTAVTVEFWMWSVDNCNQGVPFSYATGPYGDGDNSFLIYGYNNWMIDVMEENGGYSDRDSGTGSADGQWHHVAVTWASQDGHTHLYLDGRKAWSTVRGKGKRIPSGGTLVIGREQDCPGGCFDSREGAAGQTQRTYQLEYGAQDFIGVMDEIRIWSTVRSQSQIQQGIASDVKRTEVNEADVDIGRIKHNDPDLVAYWTFEEGSGYLVKDVTGKGHDLHIQQAPQWRVVGPQQLCGNGLVEGLEHCDDGNTASGDGCSSTCQIEEGFRCSGLQPSTCWPADESDAATAAAQSGVSHDTLKSTFSLDIPQLACWTHVCACRTL
ncbi:hypothetical protein ABBQ32_008228 [Trebouxia sp. C0010 RCD-2024]